MYESCQFIICLIIYSIWHKTLEIFYLKTKQKIEHFSSHFNLYVFVCLIAIPSYYLESKFKVVAIFFQENFHFHFTLYNFRATD